MTLAIRFLLLSNAVWLAAGIAPAQTVAEVRGIVLDGRDGQAVPSASIHIDGSAAEARSDTFGRFTFAAVAAGAHVLKVSSPGYKSTETAFTLDAGTAKDFQISLVPNLLLQRTVVNASEQLGAESARSAAGDEFSLQPDDLLNLSSVMADDPLRALQAIPGVASDNDFEARFSLRGADYNRTGIYLDGVLIPNALHGLEGSGLIGSSSIFNPSLVQDLTLYKGAYSEKYGDRSAGAVDVESREGEHDRTHVQLMANIAQAGFEAEGPLPEEKACSWISGFRQSYIQKVLGDSIPDPSLAFSTRDAQGRVTCHAGGKNTLTAEVIDSWTDLDRSSMQKSLQSTELMTSAQHLWLGNVAWTFAPSSNALITNRASWIQDHYDNRNASLQPVGHGEETDFSWSSDASWMWRPGSLLSGGMAVRDIRGDDYTLRHFSAYRMPPQIDQGSGNDLLTDGYAEQAWTGWRNHLHLALGGRFDHDGDSSRTVFSPQAALAVHLTASTQLDLGYGQYTQFPALAAFDSNLGGHGLLPIRSNQATVAVEQRMGTHTRVRVEAYNRTDRDLLLQPYLNPRLVNGVVVLPSVSPLYENAGRGYGRGLEVFAERKLARRVSGWLSYAYGHSLTHDGVVNAWYPATYDQKQTVSAYAVYDWKPTVTFSSRWTYGSGFPLPGYILPAAGKYPYLVASVEDGARLPAYSRLDFRMNKTWNREGMRIRLYAEVQNLLNATNYAFGSFNGFDPKTRRADVSIEQLFPILPAAGVVFQW